MWRFCLAALLVTAGCAEMNETQKQHEIARTQGKYMVRLSNDVEGVAGRCKFVRAINADDEPDRRPLDAELADYFREEAVYYGADTVVVRDRVGEAYICGPGPLNPDGTLKKSDAGPH